jgi:Ca-activated chloride channel homolog
MKTRIERFTRLGEEKGNVLVLAAVSLLSVFCFASFAIDAGCILTARNQLQSAVDAAALAAASGLTFDPATAVQRGVINSNANRVLNDPLALQASDFSFPDSRTVRVTVERPVRLFFAKILGLETTRVRARATATLGNRDIMLIFDRSGTMDDDTVNPRAPQPITDTKTAAKTFVDLVAANTYVSDRIGLVSYSTNAALVSTLGRNFTTLKTRIDGYTADGYTNIGEAIQVSNNHLFGATGTRTFKTEILLSDGMANRPGSGMPTNQTAIAFAYANARIAADHFVKIYTISLGNDTDWALMTQIASMTNGKHYHAPTAADLGVIFHEIAGRIPCILVN